MLKKVLIGLAAVIVVFIIVAALQSADFRVERSVKVATSPAAVFAHVNDLHKWQAWSPFYKMDTSAKNTFEGSPEGQGAKMSWDGNKEVGQGSMTITESHPGEFIKFLLEFKKPFESTSTADFAFKPEGDQTVVTWGMSGKKNFVMKAVGLFMDCDKMLGPTFEQGLADLKAVAEAGARK